MITPRLIFATANPGKVEEVRRFAAWHGIEVCLPADLGIVLPEIKETGSSLEENALLKYQALQQLVSSPDWVLGDDTGVEIEALGGEPGIYVRRWKDKRNEMSDEEIIAYCLEKLAHVPPERRTAQMRTVMAVGSRLRQPAVFDGVLRGRILAEPQGPTQKGLPFESIFLTEHGLLRKLHEMDQEEKKDFFTHREHALNAVLKYIAEHPISE